MMLCETKFQIPPTQAVVVQCGFQYFDFVPTQGFAGGIWLLWKSCNSNPFSISVIYKSTRFIACNLALLNLSFSLIVIFIYAPAKKVQKFDFWAELILYINSLQSPFLVIGDFNEITNSCDKLGGRNL